MKIQLDPDEFLALITLVAVGMIICGFVIWTGAVPAK